MRCEWAMESIFYQMKTENVARMGRMVAVIVVVISLLALLFCSHHLRQLHSSCY
jgi:hypothetical protein